MKRIQKNMKGFLGPIGDDLPSLIPLLFALVLFFAAFTSAFNTFDKRNSEFQVTLGVMRVASILRSDSYIAGHDEFVDLCSRVNVSDVKYMAGLLELPLDPTQDSPRIEIENPDFYESPTTGEVFECETEWEAPTLQNPHLLIRIYPVALELKDDSRTVVESGFIVRPMLLVVVTWQ